MKTAYLDCIGGISGDMLIGAFLNAGFKMETLKRALSGLNISGFEISKRDIKRHHINATKFDVRIEKSNRRYKAEEIIKIIKRSALDNEVKEAALKVFAHLFKAETRVHKTKDSHLHELGDLDTIIDVVGICICMKEWDIQKLYFSELKLGKGVVKSESGQIPVPAPATLELLKAIPIKFSNIESELVTPTGAAILATFGVYCPEYKMSVKRIGYGAGFRDLKELPNALRILIGETISDYDRDTVTVMETAIDDTMPIVYTYLYDELFKLGALDVYISNIQMKKNRPGQLLTVILPNRLLTETADFIFRETATIGLRYYRAERLKLHRYSKKVSTELGDIDVKISGTKDEIYKISPEFESCRKIAKTKKVALAKVYETAKKAAALSAFLIYALAAFSFGDTVYLKDGSEVKGIVVEEYKDRIIISTEYGEAEMSKREIARIDYDLMEQNLIALAKRQVELRNYSRAYLYYDKARKINPQCEEAMDGIRYLEGYLFRKELAKKEEEVERRQEVEDFETGGQIGEGKEALSKLRDLLGIEIEDTGKSIKIARIYRKFPAFNAGAAKEDIISSIWGRLTGYMSTEEVADILTERANLEIKMQVDRRINVKPGDIKPQQFDLRFEGLCLANLTEESRAFKAGLRDSDLILAMDDSSIRYTPTKEVVKMLKKPRILTVRRELTVWRTE